MKRLIGRAAWCFGVVLAVLVVSAEGALATIAEEVPLDGGNWSANDEGYLELDKHYTRGHVDMNVGSVRLCGSFPFYWPCVDIDYWVPKWMSEVAVMTKPQVGSGVPNEAGKGRYFFHARTKAVWTGPIPTGDSTKTFLMPCTRNNACIGIPTPEASPAMLPSYVDFFYDSREDRCWSDESILQCGDKGGGACPFNAFDAEMNGNVSPATSSSSCSMKPLGAFDFWRIAPPFGNWGRALPRTGHVIHSNKIAAGGLAALRAFNVSRYPVEVWPQEGFMRLPLSHPDVDGPAPIGQPAIFPWVGPFPCTHLMDNDRTGLRGTIAFPSGVDLGSIFGGNYCAQRDPTSSGLHHDPQPDLSTPDPDDTTAENRSGCNRDAWKQFEAYNSQQARARQDMMMNDSAVTAAQAQAAHPPDLEIFRWVYWRFRKCTCPWPSPSWAYAEWFKSQGKGWGDNSCIKPTNLAALPREVADLAYKTMREAGKAVIDKVKSEAQAIGVSAASLGDTAKDGLETMVGDLNATGGLPTSTPGTPDGVRLSDAAARQDVVSNQGLAGMEGGWLNTDDAQTSSTLTGVTTLSGGNQDIGEVSGSLQVSGGLQNQHMASLQGPQDSAAVSLADGIPAGVANLAERPALRTAIDTAMTQAETLVFGGADTETLEETELDRFNPPGNRFGSGSYGSDPWNLPEAPPLAGECGLGGRDCNDGEADDWDSILANMNADYTDPALMEPGAGLDGGTTGITQNVGSGVCDLRETQRCAVQNCSWRQCALGATRTVCSQEDSGRCPYGFRCTSWDTAMPPNCTGGVYDVPRCCTVCCNYGEVSTGGGSTVGGGTHCNKNCGLKEDCDYFHRHGCCLANNPGNLVQLELDTIGFRDPNLPSTHAASCNPDAPDLSATCFGNESNLCPNTTGTCSWAPGGC